MLGNVIKLSLTPATPASKKKLLYSPMFIRAPEKLVF
jgi:hypothetical protein